MKSISLAAAAIGVFWAASAIGGGSGKPSKAKSEPSQCRKDADCALVADDCCGCTAGGKQRAIPLKNRDAYQRDLRKRCEGTLCAEVISDDPSCKAASAKCEEGRCVLGS